MSHASKITSVDLKNGKLATTTIDRKWTMFTNKTQYKTIKM